MGILLGEEDNTPDWDKEIERIVGKHEDIEEITFEEKKPQELSAVLELNYDITLDEEDRAFRLFQRLYVFKRSIINTVLFGIVAAIFLFQIITGKSTYLSFGLLAVSLAMIALAWITPIRVRKMLMVALEALKDDRYIFRLFDRKFEIETIIPQEDEQLARELVREDKEKGEFEGSSDDEDDSEYDGRIKPEKSVYDYPSDDMRIVETDDMFLIFISKETFHIIPKRALSDEDVGVLNESFISKFDNYLNASSK